VPVVSAVPGVGQNLQDHPVLSGLNFRARHRTGLVRDNGGGAVATWRSTSAGGGAGTDAGAGGGAGAGAAGGRADLHAAVYQGRHVDMASGPGPRAGLGASADVFSIAAGLLAPRSTGYLRVLSVSDGAGGSDGLGGPGADDLEIQPNLLADSADVAALSEAVSFVMDLADTTAYRELIESPLADVPLPAGGTVSRAADLERFVRTHAGSLGDPCGTAAMGSAPSAGAVVDSSLKVFGVTGLRVADASVIPVIPRCGLRAPVVAIAERAADLISS
jgi:choline dehydrogenase